MNKLATTFLFASLFSVVTQAAPRLDRISEAEYRRDLEVLTGEADMPAEIKGPQRIQDRFSPSDIESARQYIILELAKAGYSEFKTESFKIHNRDAQGLNFYVEIPGRKHPNEVVILSAHYDSHHEGVPGANDNGTGTVAVLQAAKEAMRAGWQPDYTLRFAFFDGEERGLLGSRWHLENFVLENNKQLRLLVNLDMIGDNPAGSKHVMYFGEDDGRAIGRALESVNTQFALGFKFEPFNFFISDQIPFQRAKMPALSLFENPHQADGQPTPDSYRNGDNHTARDRVSTINLSYAAEVTRLATAFVYDVSRQTSVWKTPAPDLREIEKIRSRSTESGGHTHSNAVTVRFKKPMSCRAVFDRKIN